MILNFRYHLFTISAIFAALGIGILIGSSIIGHDKLILEQERIIKDIGDDIKNIRQENLQLKNDITEMEKELEYRKKIEKRFYTLVLKDIIKGENYYLILSDRLKENYGSELEYIFEKAGVQLKFINNIEEFQLDKQGKVIIWGKQNINRFKSGLYSNLKGEEIIYLDNKGSIADFILSLLESETNSEQST
ncbi:copper transporter [Halothermothrix orenii]|uniref:Uncharacterized protein n=1 Tax=Halothermothrix orenii (strain H 168 / OCM 544 / DSM 9562) TaxID=373903 RepID=B8D2J1_HALOH|nr:copper transporter [Halothermothrix orenii]ACL69418.1 hypothetical protein Hore_06610 [Halothermothrix orenii H 168]